MATNLNYHYQLSIVTWAMMILVMYMIIDLWAGHRDMHNIANLQRRVGQLEQQCKP